MDEADFRQPIRLMQAAFTTRRNTGLIFLIPWLLAGAPSAAAQSFVFAPSPRVGNGPLSVVAADVNGDGTLDLVSSNSGTNTLAVLTNNGNGTFSFSAMLVVGESPHSVVAADMNGDGKMDLISGVGGGLMVLTNHGKGAFTAASTNAVGISPNSVVAADVNGDGKLDLICPGKWESTFNGYLRVLTNLGNGTFSRFTSLAVGINPISVVATDVNGDGKLDLISANLGDSGYFGGNLTVLTNIGNGSFTFAASLGVRNPLTVVAADVNGDGKQDLISASGTDLTLKVLLNSPVTGFVLSSSPRVGEYPASVVAVDVNGDGKPDLICANQSTNALTVLTNNGNGTFNLSATLAGDYSVSVVAADVNGDGSLDLISANGGGNALSVLTNNGTGKFTLSSTLRVGSLGHARSWRSS